MRIVNTEQEHESVVRLIQSHGSLIIPVLTDAHKHPCVNPPSLLYVEVADTKFILPYDHNEAAPLDLDYAIFNIRTKYRIFAPNKKALQHTLVQDDPHIHDVASLEYLATGKVTDPETFYPPAMKQMLGRFHKRENVFKAIPIMILVEYLEAYAKHLKEVVYKYDRIEGYEFLHNTLLPATYYMEQSGIHVDESLVEERFKHLVADGHMYPEYNPYTAAGRVSCRHGGFNWVGMDKSDGSRKLITSRHEKGVLVLIDYESFHPRLIGELINFELPPTSLHTYFGKQYFGVEELTKEQYEESKRITFTLSYSDEEIDDLPPYFQKMRRYRQFLWKKFEEDGYVKTRGGKLIRREHMENPSPAKLFNYMVQMTETEVAMEAIKQLRRVMLKAQSRVILYTYDSVMIDFALSDGKELLQKVSSVLGMGGRFPTRMYYGKTYDDMKSV